MKALAGAWTGVAHLVEFRQADIFASDLREASVVTLFLFPDKRVEAHGATPYLRTVARR